MTSAKLINLGSSTADWNYFYENNKNELQSCQILGFSAIRMIREIM